MQLEEKPAHPVFKSRIKIKLFAAMPAILGNIAQVAVLPAFRSVANSELFALVSGDPEKLKKREKKYAIEHLYIPWRLLATTDEPSPT